MNYKKDRAALLALPLADKEVISNAYRAREGYSFTRVGSAALMLALFCAMWWATTTDLLAEIEKQMPTVFGFGAQSLMNTVAWLGILGATVILAIELMGAHKANKESLVAIADARKLGVDVTTIDAWLLKQLEDEIYKAYKQKHDQKSRAVPAEFEGQEWKYNFDPDSYFQYRSGFLHWLDCGPEQDEVYRSYFDAVRNGDRIDKQILWKKLNKAPLTCFAWGAVGLGLLFSSTALGFWDTEGSIRHLFPVALVVSMVFMARLHGFVNPSELLPSSTLGNLIHEWVKFHPEILGFVTTNGLYERCCEIEFCLLRDYVHTVRAEIFRATI